MGTLHRFASASGAEGCSTCPGDCGACPPSNCGNGTCDPGETCSTCSDCPGSSKGKPNDRFCCGDGIHDIAEGNGSICGGNY